MISFVNIVYAQLFWNCNHLWIYFSPNHNIHIQRGCALFNLFSLFSMSCNKHLIYLKVVSLSFAISLQFPAFWLTKTKKTRKSRKALERERIKSTFHFSVISRLLNCKKSRAATWKITTFSLAANAKWQNELFAD